MGETPPRRAVEVKVEAAASAGRGAAAQSFQLSLLAKAIRALLLIAFGAHLLAAVQRVKPLERIIPGSAAAVNQQVKC